MAGASLLALLDDIATILDDVSVMTKVAAKKTAGVLGDDLALNAQQVSGVAAARELPVVMAVARGSLVNKAILVPAALAVSAFAPWAVTPLLMAGGAFLCYEGFEKLAHRWLARGTGDARRPEPAPALAASPPDVAAAERQKIKGAVRTDFILSAEIIVISLGAVATAPLPQRIGVLVGIAIIMTVGVYGLVAGIVKLDDAGLHLHRTGGDGAFARAQRATGAAILRAAPWLMKGLSVAGTAAMFLVGGGILAHGVPALHHAVAAAALRAGAVFGALVPLLAAAIVGIAAGAVALLAMTALRTAKARAWRRAPEPTPPDGRGARTRGSAR